MYKPLFTALFLTLLTTTARAQPCWPDGIQIQSQFDVDNLASLSQGCSSVAGSVTISGPNITNLDSLSWITAIDGNLWIYMNPALTSLQGLSNLVSVSGTVNIFGNGSLENLAGLNNLLTIGGSLNITEDSALLNVDGLNNLSSIGEDLSIGYNPLLLNVDGLSNLTTVGRTVNIGANNALVSLSGLDNLTTIGLDAYFADMNNLLNLDGMNKLKTIGGTLHIEFCKQLSAISGLQALDTIRGSLTLIANEALTHFRGGGNPVSIGDSIAIFSNFLLAEICPLRQPAIISSLGISETKLASLDFLQPITAVKNYLSLADNDSLTDMSVFDQLERVGKTLGIERNKLENMSSFQNLRYVGGDLRINQYDGLTNLSGLENLDTVGGVLALNTLSDLIDLKGLSGLKWVGGDMSVAGLDTLENFRGLEQIRAIGGTLDLYGNTGLRDFSGLDSLTSIGRNFQIYGCPRLTSLNRLGKLDSVGGRFSVSFNPLLSACAMEALCRKIDLLPDSVLIENNASGCNSAPEVAQECALPPGQCLSYGIAFDSQAEVDRFPADFPGCTEIAGPVYVFGPGIKNLDSLRVLHSVGKQLNITSTWLSTLGGLGNLTRIGGSLNISFNDSLRRLDQLEKLDSIGGSVSIYNNFKLNKCTAEALCQYLKVSPDSVVIQNNAPGCNSTAEVGINCDLPPGQCLPEGITFDAQVEIDRFPLDYPGCRHIIGYASIIGSDITSLDSLQVLTGVGVILTISGTRLTNLTGLEGITTLPSLSVSYNDLLTGLTELGDVDSAGLVAIEGNAALTNLNGLEGFKSISDLTVLDNDALTSLDALSHLSEIKGLLFVAQNDALTNLDGLEGITAIGGSADISYNVSLSDLTALSNLVSVDWDLVIQGNTALPDFNGLHNLVSVGNQLAVAGLPLIQNFAQFEKLTQIGAALQINSNIALNDLTGLEQLVWADDSTADRSIIIGDNPVLTSLAALSNLATPQHSLRIYGNNALTNLAGLENITAATYLGINNNASLTNLDHLAGLKQVGPISISDNLSLSDCAIFAVCNQLLNNPGNIYVANNALGCNTPAEVEAQCSSIPVLVDVLLDNNANCAADAADAPAPGVQVRLEGMLQMLLKPADSLGQARFAYLGNEPLILDLPQFPAGHWAVCQDSIQLDPGGSTDTLRASFLLSPLSACPELEVRLGMPSTFRGCLVSSGVQVSTQNTGAVLAEGVKTAVVMPSVLELESSVPALSGQSGDTLLFDLGDLQPFETGVVQLTVRSKCDTFLLGQTLCWEAFSAMDNPCPVTLPAFSEIKLSAGCIGDTLLRFTIKNIGDAPTQGPHQYTLIRNETVVQTASFNLGNQQSMVVDVPADSATYRMEATKLDDGTLTAVALENCGGLTPGWITAFWLEKGPAEYDFDCRQVIGSYDPNQKTAVPAGVEPYYTLAANRPVQYTIDFQNTGTDTAYRVLLRDVLPADFDLNTFRAGASSHPCTWEIRGNTLNVLFFPIALPDSNVNEPASRGFFSFELDQLPDLPVGTDFYNTASIIFDFNPPIITNTVYHRIGQLSVSLFEPEQQARLWRVEGNPTRETAVFRALTVIPGEKRFELCDVSGRPVRTALFSGQSFVFQRDMLPGGVYFFRIGDEWGRWFTGKMVVTD